MHLHLNYVDLIWDFFMYMYQNHLIQIVQVLNYKYV